MTEPESPNANTPKNPAVACALALAALGVVFGDIGTSPLYALKACFDFSGASPLIFSDVVGTASLLVWALVIVVCIKYTGFIMRADHDGEGGILALLALGAPPSSPGRPVIGGALTLTIIIGAAMLLGDGSITPAISVISAVEGLKLLSPAAAPFVVAVSVAILIGLFAIQSNGTERLGRLFGPVMLLWFGVLGVAGAFGIARHPEILAALDPRQAIAFLAHHGPGGFFILGGVVLAITGVEALYADLSHFGRRPVVLAWYGIVFPALILCYLGESATAAADPASLTQPFYALIPSMWRIPAILLATLATIIASQALISGAFTLVQQAMALGIAPRLEVKHTSDQLRGQVYLPVINTALAVGCISLVLAFRSSDKLASAFGLAVSCTMLATSVAWYRVATTKLRLSRAIALPAVAAFIVVDSAFVIAGLPKFADGGWVPFLVSAILTVIATTWRVGRDRVADAFLSPQASLTSVSGQIGSGNYDGSATMVLLSLDPDRVPFFATHAWVRDRMCNERVVILTLMRERTPRVAETERVEIKQLHPRLYQVIAHFGYMEPQRISPIVEACRAHGVELDHDDVSYLSVGFKIEPSERTPNSLIAWRRGLFIGLFRVSRPLPDELAIRAELRIEVGVTVNI